jgi:hypothetical protein
VHSGMGVAAETSAPHVAAASTAAVSMLAMAVRLRAGALREMGEPRAITDPAGGGGEDA